jgi:predicted TIM-barrel fold metal-dependent hydrolase
MNSLRRRTLLTAGFGLTLCTAGAASAVNTSATKTSTAGSGRIDVHHHFTPPAWLAWASGLGLIQRDRLPWWTKWDLDATLSMMDKLGIETSVVSPALPVDRYLDDNQHRESLRVAYQATVDLIKAHPGRFAFFAKLPLDNLAVASWSLRHGIDELGALGVFAFTHDSKGTYLGDPAFDRVFAELNERKAVVNIHPTELKDIRPNAPAIAGVPSFLCDYPFDTTRAAINLTHKGSLDRFPDLSFILPHGGGFLPYIAARFEISAEQMAPKIDAARVRDYLHRFYYDTAAPMAPSSTPSLVAAVDPARILYATDWPACSATIIEAAGSALDTDGALDDEQRGAINRANALRLMPALANR